MRPNPSPASGSTACVNSHRRAELPTIQLAPGPVGHSWLRAARSAASVPLVVTTFLWGLVLPAFGMMQMNLLPGPWHWVIRTVHLLTGLVAMRLADLLFRKARAAGEGEARLAGRPKEYAV